MTDRKPGRVPQELIDFFEGKESRPSWSYTEVWGEEHKLAFTVAKAVEADLLANLRDAVTRAQNEGIAFERWRRELEPVLADKGWWGQLGLEGDDKKSRKARSRRLETIYETNLRMARAHGQWERIQRRQRTQPFLRYRLGPSARHRPEHVAFDGLIYRANHPFWQTHFPPNGYGCKCWVEPLTAARARALGGASQDLDADLFPPQTYRDPRNGQKREAPYGVDPGFEFEPGLGARKAGVNQALAKKT